MRKKLQGRGQSELDMLENLAPHRRRIAGVYAPGPNDPPSVLEQHPLHGCSSDMKKNAEKVTDFGFPVETPTLAE